MADPGKQDLRIEIVPSVVYRGHHEVRFTTVYNERQQSTNVEFLSTEGLEDLDCKICDYLAAVHHGSPGLG